MDTPVFSLNRGNKSKRPRLRETFELHYAPRRLRLISGLIDGLTSCILAVFCSYTLGSMISPEIYTGLSFPPTPDKYAVYGFLLATLLAVSLLYPVISLLIYKTTLGIKLLGMQLKRKNDRPLLRSNSVVRGMLMPLSLVCFGYLHSFVQENVFHDHFAKTKLVVAKKRRILENP
ncbi:MAG: RDD family protein [Bdellovibrionota bacterium]